MARYIWINGEGWVTLARYADYVAEKATGQSDFPAPRVISDIEEYRSPIDGKLIGSRKQRRDELRSHGCVEWEPGIRQSAPNGRDRAKKLTRIDDKPRLERN